MTEGWVLMSKFKAALGVHCRGAFLVGIVVLIMSCSGQQKPVAKDTAGAAGVAPTWLAGDHHVHSRFSVGWDREQDPPAPIVGGDAIYPIPMNALMARHYGLGWMVTTDHGGPEHSRVTRDWAHPALLRSRTVVPDLLQYHGLELNSPGGDHATLIVPRSNEEAAQLYQYETAYDRNETWPHDGSRNNTPLMVSALKEMGAAEQVPVVIANHPSRSGSASSPYGLYSPAELRTWNDAAPHVAVGFAGAPGHQAITLAPDGAVIPDRPRGGYVWQVTRGGFDPMTAKLGGLWDSLLGEGRKWWITANSDSHRHYTELGGDFWPGEYSKTWVHAAPEYDAVLEGLRQGRMFVATGDLITGLSMTLVVDNRAREIWPGDTVTLRDSEPFSLTVSVIDPSGPNAGGRTLEVARLDLIVGDISGLAPTPDQDTNPSARVIARFSRSQMQIGGELLTARWDGVADGHFYVRLRGTNTDELEPEPDPRGENPWDDLWFYSNPFFVDTLQTSGGSEQL